MATNFIYRMPVDTNAPSIYVEGEGTYYRVNAVDGKGGYKWKGQEVYLCPKFYMGIDENIEKALLSAVFKDSEDGGEVHWFNIYLERGVTENEQLIEQFVDRVNFVTQTVHSAVNCSFDSQFHAVILSANDDEVTGYVEMGNVEKDAFTAGVVAVLMASAATYLFRFSDPIRGRDGYKLEEGSTADIEEGTREFSRAAALIYVDECKKVAAKAAIRGDTFGGDADAAIVRKCFIAEEFETLVSTSFIEHSVVCAARGRVL